MNKFELVNLTGKLLYCQDVKGFRTIDVNHLSEQKSVFTLQKFVVIMEIKLLK